MAKANKTYTYIMWRKKITENIFPSTIAQVAARHFNSNATDTERATNNGNHKNLI